MLETRQHTNRDCIAWRPVSARESGFLTPNVPVEYGITDSMEWPTDEDVFDVFAQAELARMTPPNAELRALAAEFPPPQAWFENEDDVPF